MYEYVQGFLKDLSIENIHYYNFDEIPMKNGIGATLASLKEAFFDSCNTEDSQIEKFDETNYLTYDEKIMRDGGIDFMLVGLSLDGHFCGNMSGAFDDFSSGCYKVDSHLNEELEGLLAAACGSKENVPDYFVTFGPRTVMSCKKS